MEGYADLAPSQGWREAQNKMNIVLVRSHSVEVDFDITSTYEDTKEEREGKGGRTTGNPSLLFRRIKTEMEISGDTFLQTCMCVCACVCVCQISGVTHSPAVSTLPPRSFM